MPALEKEDVALDDNGYVYATLPATEAAMKELGKTFEPVIYEGAGHGFLRQGEDPQGSEADKKAHAAAWERWKKLLAAL